MLDKEIGKNLYQQADGRTYELQAVAIRPGTGQRKPVTQDTRDRGWPIRNTKHYVSQEEVQKRRGPSKDLRELMPLEEITAPVKVEPDVLEPEIAQDPLPKMSHVEPGAPLDDDDETPIEPDAPDEAIQYDLAGRIPLSKMELGSMTHAELDAIIEERNLGTVKGRMPIESKVAWMRSQEAERLSAV